MSHPPFSQEPAESEIQHLAYLLWLEGGRMDGRDQEHWFAAREILRHRAPRVHQAAAPATSVSFPPHNLGPSNPPIPR